MIRTQHLTITPDDFVVLTCTKRESQQARADLRRWLAQRGLKLSLRKTRIVHLKKGFNFLGFNVKRYANRSKQGKSVCLTKPSREAVQTFRKTMKSAWKKVLTLSMPEVIRILNPKVMGWCRYFCVGVAKRVFSDMDHWMWGRQKRFVVRRHPHKLWGWRIERYWGKTAQRQDRWVFMDKPSGKYLWKMKWTPIRRHVLIRGRASPDDPTLQAYWQRCRTGPPSANSRIREELWRRQLGKCLVCSAPLDNGEALEKHHVKPRRLGGADRTDNLCLIHKTCHVQVHSTHPYRPIGAAREEAMSIWQAIGKQHELIGLQQGLQKGKLAGKQLGLREGLERGLERGKLAGKLETARSLLVAGIDPKVIAKATGLSRQKLTALRKK